MTKSYVVAGVHADNKQIARVTADLVRLSVVIALTVLRVKGSDSLNNARE
jgi:hypothetical protein